MSSVKQISIVISVVVGLFPSFVKGAEGPIHRILLDHATISIDKSEPSYLQYAAEDLASYLGEITGRTFEVRTRLVSQGGAENIVVVIGSKMTASLGLELEGISASDECELRSSRTQKRTIVSIGSSDPHVTNFCVATFMHLIRADEKVPYVEAPFNRRIKPSVSVRGLQAGGWPIKYPYAAWREDDWKQFIDIAWAHRVNSLLLSPLFETLPIPLSPKDEAYVNEVRRIVDYAQSKRGMEVWLGMPANRIAIGNCGVEDPRLRPYWINGCQKDMNPADPEQFARIVAAVEPFYRIVNNVDGVLMGDADPGGWPNSPLSEQLKIFKNARAQLDRYNIHGKGAKLADFMWIGWGRHKFFTSTDRLVTGFDWTEKNPDESDVAFMAETIRNFRENLAEPWTVVAGMTPYLESAKREHVLSKAIYFPYGAIELEPAFPSTNVLLKPARDVFLKRAEYSQLDSVFGNNQIMLLQFPLTHYFFSTAWDNSYVDTGETQNLQAVAEQIYPEHSQLLVEAFLALRESDPEKIVVVRSQLDSLVQQKALGRPGVLSHHLFPDRSIIARDLVTQLDIRLARQLLLKALHGKPSPEECARLMTDYFHKLLAWNEETGWEKVIDTGIWTQPIYEQGKDFTEAISHLKEILGQGEPYTSYEQVNSFFQGIQTELLKLHRQNSVMIGCIEPFKLAVVQMQ